ncbi:hypothetical protein L211DRAFT_331642 [Terfezia boudieri ATCC MYA-4762]|uniref:Uncharacterized protein n=1 Tax=Terfezia boudieri ATCC MYA-4762 TaxID=1051890 RepID=A0A3N4LX07_9PEZI|nr:hypothetical protein L211DRAFT_331642 [Terfezia boudieri ATCC MYA-4762]
MPALLVMSSSYFRPPKNTTSIETRSTTQAPPQAQTMSSDNKVPKPSSLARIGALKEDSTDSTSIIKEIQKVVDNKQHNKETVLTLIEKLNDIQKQGKLALTMLEGLSLEVGEDHKSLETMLDKLDENMKSIKESWKKEKK